jgi:membrane protease YdiL (CAAX protease family)
MALKKLAQISKATDSDWYQHPLLLCVFLVFLFLFIFSIYALTMTGGLIKNSQDMTKDEFKNKYGQDISQIEACYVINTITLIITVLVLMFFLSKLIKLKQLVALLKNYTTIALLLFIVFAASYNVNTFDQTQNTNASNVSSVSIVIIIIALIGLILIGVNTYKNHAKAKS